MKLILISIVTFLLGCGTTLSQGYEWEWSPRSPKEMPTNFLGLEFGIGYAQHTGTLEYFEDLIPCCTFDEGGIGIPMRVLVIGEHWIAPKTALQAGLGLSFQTAEFTKRDTLVRRDEPSLITEYAFAPTITYLSLQIGARQRLFSFLSIGVDVRGSLGIGSSASLERRIISPEDEFFVKNPPSKVHQITNLGDLNNLATFVLEPAISLQYDIALGLGTVLSPSVNVSMPLNSLSNQYSWRYLGVGLGVRLSRGL